MRRSSKRASVSIRGDGASGLSHGAVRRTMSTIVGPMAESGTLSGGVRAGGSESGMHHSVQECD
eukprot:7380875-Prymnesium_polylepis.1